MKRALRALRCHDAGWPRLFLRAGLVVALVGGWGVCPVTNAETNSGAGILFLHCRLQGEALTVLWTTQTPGVVKPPRIRAGEIQYELLTANGQSLWRGVLDDPRVERFDYEDPPRSGRLKPKVILREAAEFVVRVPVRPDARWIEFRKLPALRTAPPSGAAPPPPRLLGRFELPSPTAAAPP